MLVEKGGKFDPELVHSDLTLKLRLNVTDCHSSIVLNDSFSGWKEYFEEKIQVPESRKEYRYEDEIDKRLYVACCKQFDSNIVLKDARKSVFVVHPFYLALSQMHYVENDKIRDEASLYLDNLIDLMKACKDKDDVNVVVFETLWHYAAITSLLVEQGLVNDVIITEPSSGVPLDSDDIIPYAGNDILICGTYDVCCLTDATKEIFFAFNRQKIKDIRIKNYGISDLSLYPPCDTFETIISVKPCEILPDKVLSLKESYKKLDMAEKYKHKTEPNPIYTQQR